MNDMPGFRQGPHSTVEVLVSDQEIVGVISRQGEDADAGLGQDACQRCEDADLGKTERSCYAEATESALRLERRGQYGFVTDDR